MASHSRLARERTAHWIVKRISRRSPAYIGPIQYVARSGVYLSELSGCGNYGNPKGNLNNHLAILN
jgi:hypothetical protein